MEYLNVPTQRQNYANSNRTDYTKDLVVHFYTDNAGFKQSEGLGMSSITEYNIFTDKQPDQDDESDKLYWPSTSVLTTRLRRLITAYQRSYKREQMKLEALSRSDRRRRRPRDEVKAREAERNAAISEKRQR